MRTIGEIRRLRLRALLDEHAITVAELGARLGRTRRDSTLSQILNGAPDSKTGTPRQMGEAQARLIETKFDKPVGWMDRDPDFDALLLRAPSTALRAEEPGGRYALDLSQLLAAVGVHLSGVPPSMRHAVGTLLRAWAEDGGAAHYRAPLADLLRGVSSKRPDAA